MTDTNAYHLARYHARRKKALRMLGGKCKQCGSKKDLQIDHVDPSTKAMDVAKEWGNPLFFEELKKCQALCRSCHKKKTSSEQRRDIHGTWGMYRNRKCRCDVCRAFVADYMRRRRKKS